MLPLRPNVCIAILNANNQILIGERMGSPNHWQLPQGGLEKHLSLEENVYKEIQEEVGISRDKIELIAKLNVTHEYEFARPPDYMKDKWRGQSQSFYLARFTGQDQDIDLTTHHEQEFTAYQWIEMDRLLDVVDPIRIDGYRKMLAEISGNSKLLNPVRKP